MDFTDVSKDLEMGGLSRWVGPRRQRDHGGREGADVATSQKLEGARNGFSPGAAKFVTAPIRNQNRWVA